tara:strand:- start:10704 stop:11162 length:459 start_codon:yes stop_codon:yes gene_type:complete
MPGSHFSSKRLRKALQTKADTRMAGTVPRIGRPLASMRLLPRVEKDCNCRVPKPKPPAFIVGKNLRVQFNEQIIDPLDSFGSSTTHVSWIHESGLQVGDTVSFINPSNNELFTSTVRLIQAQGSNNRNYLAILTDPHGNAGQVPGVDINLHI